MKFKKIVIVEPVLLNEPSKKKLKNYCQELVSFDVPTLDQKKILERIQDADCILVSYRTVISKKVIYSCRNLKHVMLCCSYYGKEFCKVDIDALEDKNITYSYLSGHGDHGVLEFTISSVIQLLHGFSGKRWKNEILDLSNLKVGILGLGNLGSKVASLFSFLDADVYYYSRTRKKNLEEQLNITYLELEELLSTVDILSINVNRDVCLIGGSRLKQFGNGKIIVNTSIGKCYEFASLKEWLQNKDNYYICDKATIDSDLEEILDYENIIYSKDISGDTKQCYDRASEQILKRIQEVLSK